MENSKWQGSSDGTACDFRERCNDKMVNVKWIGHEEDSRDALVNVIQTLLQEIKELKLELDAFKFPESNGHNVACKESFRAHYDAAGVDNGSGNTDLQLGTKKSVHQECKLKAENTNGSSSMDNYTAERSTAKIGARDKLRINALARMQSLTLQKCRYCGNRHRWGSQFCPAFGKCCSKCGKHNHIGKVCESNHKEKTGSKQKTTSSTLKQSSAWKEIGIAFISTKRSAQEIHTVDYHSSRLQINAMKTWNPEKLMEHLQVLTAKYGPPKRVNLLHKNKHCPSWIKQLKNQLQQLEETIEFKTQQLDHNKWPSHGHFLNRDDDWKLVKRKTKHFIKK
jgi:hypothetical protein